MHSIPEEDFKQVAQTALTKLKDSFRTQRTRPYEWRLQQLNQLRRMVSENGILLQSIYKPL